MSGEEPKTLGEVKDGIIDILLKAAIKVEGRKVIRMESSTKINHHLVAVILFIIVCRMFSNN